VHEGIEPICNNLFVHTPSPERCSSTRWVRPRVRLGNDRNPDTETAEFRPAERDRALRRGGRAVSDALACWTAGRERLPGPQPAAALLRLLFCAGVPLVETFRSYAAWVESGRWIFQTHVSSLMMRVRDTFFRKPRDETLAQTPLHSLC